MNSVLFRVDGSKKSGYGHFYRCLAIAERISPIIKPVFFTKNASELYAIINSNSDKVFEVIPITDESYQLTDLIKTFKRIVIDSYSVDSSYFISLKNLGFETIYIDDLIVNYEGIDHLINHNQLITKTDYSESLNKNTKLHLGFDYLMVRNPIINCIDQDHSSNLNTIFLAVGGTDVFNLTEELLDNILNNNLVETVHVLRKEPVKSYLNHTKVKWHYGLNAYNLVDLVKSCKLAITTASSLSLECCCIGINLITFHIAENQKLLDGFLANKNLSVSLGNYQTNKKQLPVLIEEILEGKRQTTSDQKKYFKKFNFNKLENFFIKN